ncbi:coiled-coil domain-containing protein 103 isoform X2 [Peromyscus eremicus]|uniref:coiled-coil domain-containing protein 103 isoform X2 n=1 Tax=Peromyscus eremicus TaxID=42410 RepID=UPI0027DD16FA|nr:coiled-coil domain-containing protein 103 isoform X2 [Peromyscus eremicus]
MEKNDAINFKTLEKELQAALAADEKYKRENAAKLRAVEQRVPSYEEFRGIVLASHLKPLEQKDKEKSPFQPATSAEFYRDWRRHLRSGPERYQALLQLGGPELGHLFQNDVGFGLLGELLVALAEHVKLSDRAAVLGILHSLASTGRFTLNLSLLSPAEREGCQRLFEKLQAMGTTGPTQGALSVEEPSAGLPGEEELLQRLLGLYGVH